jgi:hypothetical protein
VNAFFDDPRKDGVERHGIKLIVIWIVEKSHEAKVMRQEKKQELPTKLLSLLPYGSSFLPL